MKLYTLLLLIIIGFEVQLFSQESANMMPNEKRLFIIINSMRKDKKIPPFRFSPKLYVLAKEHSKKASLSRSIKNKDNKLIYIRSILADGTNYIKQTEKAIRSNTNHYYTILNPNIRESAIAIEYNKKLGLYYISHALGRGPISNDSYYLQEKEFDELLSIVDIKNSMDRTDRIRFGLNRVSIIKNLKPFIDHPKNIYYTKLSAGSIIIYLKDSRSPENYLKVSFSDMSQKFKGVYNITYYFKERTFLKEYGLLKDIFGLKKAIPLSWSGYPYHFRVEDNKLKFYIHKMDKTKKQAYWITDDKIVEFRWQGTEGVYVSITKTNYGYHYVNLFKAQYNLKYPLRKQVYLRLLAEYLIRMDNFNIIDFLKSYAIRFYGPNKVETATLRNNTFKINYFYYYKDGLHIRENLLENNTISNICKTSNNSKGKLISIELKRNKKKGGYK